MSIKVGFIGACFPPDQLNSLIEEKKVRDIPANVLGWKFVKGLAQNGIPVFVVNELKISSYKESHIIFKKGWTINDGIITISTYSVLNEKLLFHLLKPLLIHKELNKASPDIIVVYSLHSPYLKAAISYAKKRKKQVICIVPDLPDNMFGNYIGLKKILKKIDLLHISRSVNSIDGFILLTSFMADKLSIKEKPYVVIEGIADNEVLNYQEKEEPCKEYILYTGSIAKEYGIPEFIESYIDSDISAELWFCGTGNYTNELLQIAEKNKKIRYLGLKNRDEIIGLQKNAALLFNPRSSQDEYTKYSFPSKTIEYLLSGTPVMMEKLPGIPDEYYNYIIKVDNGWCNELRHFFSLSINERKAIGLAGQQFVKTKKNTVAQGEIVGNFILSFL